MITNPAGIDLRVARIHSGRFAVDLHGSDARLVQASALFALRPTQAASMNLPGLSSSWAGRGLRA